MPKVFSPQTIAKFEDASASIVLRQIVRSFEAQGIRPGDDPGGVEGDRRIQFRRYVAGVDQRNPQQLERLGAAFGALVSCAATSKEEFLIKAAESDGFFFADGVFRPATADQHAFAVTRIEDLALIDDRAKRLHLLAEANPNDALAGANELVDSVCRTVLRQLDAPISAKKTGLTALAESTLAALERQPTRGAAAKAEAARVSGCVRQLSDVVATLAGTKDRSPRLARLAVAAAVAFAHFVAETYAERA